MISSPPLGFFSPPLKSSTSAAANPATPRTSEGGAPRRRKKTRCRGSLPRCRCRCRCCRCFPRPPASSPAAAAAAAAAAAGTGETRGEQGERRASPTAGSRCRRRTAAWTSRAGRHSPPLRRAGKRERRKTKATRGRKKRRRKPEESRGGLEAAARLSSPCGAPPRLRSSSRPLPLPPPVPRPRSPLSRAPPPRSRELLRAP